MVVFLTGLGGNVKWFDRFFLVQRLFVCMRTRTFWMPKNQCSTYHDLVFYLSGFFCGMCVKGCKRRKKIGLTKWSVSHKSSLDWAGLDESPTKSMSMFKGRFSTRLHNELSLSLSTHLRSIFIIYIEFPTSGKVLFGFCRQCCQWPHAFDSNRSSPCNMLHSYYALRGGSLCRQPNSLANPWCSHD
jgi:hypothetical protein